MFEIEYEKQQSVSLNVFDSVNTFSSDNSSNRSYPLDHKFFYSSKDVIAPLSDHEEYDWKVDVNSYKMLYLSYKSLNNKFDVAPEESFIEIDSSEAYYLDVNIDSTKGLDITPFVIHYSNGRKTRLTKIVGRNQLLEFQVGEDKCRLTFKVNGAGNFSIKHINLLILR